MHDYVQPVTRSCCFVHSQLVDLSCNELTEIQLPDSLPSTLQELDLTGNSSLMLEHKTLNLFRWVRKARPVSDIYKQFRGIFQGQNFNTQTLYSTDIWIHIGVKCKKLDSVAAVVVQYSICADKQCMFPSLMLSTVFALAFSHITTLKLDQKSTTTAAADTLSASTPWNHGYSEMSGQRNK